MMSQDRIQQLQEEIARRAAQPEERAGGARPVLVFFLAGERYALPLNVVREICRVRNITPLPGLPAAVLGATGLRGEVLPVLDLRRILRLPEEPVGPASRLLVVQHEKTTAAMLVDQVEDIAELPPSAIEPPPSSAPGDSWSLLEGVAHEGSRTTRLLDPDRLLEAVRHGG